MADPARLPLIAARITGGVALLCAALGLLYNVLTLTSAVAGDFDRLVEQDALVYFYPAFYAMSTFCVLCYSVLLWCAIQLLRTRLTVVIAFAVLSVVEVVYAFALGPITGYFSQAGPSIAAATGVSSAGLMAQFILLLPLWGPPAVIWARRRTIRLSGRGDR